MSIHENGLRTKLGSGSQRHRRVHTELARRIRSCGDDASFAALPAHYDWSAFQRRIVQLFHRHEEGIHVDVENGFGVRRIHDRAYGMMANVGAAVNRRSESEFG